MAGKYVLSDRLHLFISRPGELYRAKWLWGIGINQNKDWSGRGTGPLPFDFLEGFLKERERERDEN